MGFQHRDFGDEPNDAMRKVVKLCSLVDYSGMTWETAATLVTTTPEMAEGIAAAGHRADKRGQWPAPYGGMLAAPFAWPPAREG